MAQILQLDEEDQKTEKQKKKGIDFGSVPVHTCVSYVIVAHGRSRVKEFSDLPFFLFL